MQCLCYRIGVRLEARPTLLRSPDQLRSIGLSRSACSKATGGSLLGADPGSLLHAD